MDDYEYDMPFGCVEWIATAIFVVLLVVIVLSK